jgi:molybdopterin synthase catalytic subunit
MAVAQFERIGAEVEQRWPGVRLAITHRVGVLHPGELAVVMAAAAPHRAEAFAACSHALERLKQDAPIWKREVYADGAEWVGLGP